MSNSVLAAALTTNTLLGITCLSGHRQRQLPDTQVKNGFSVSNTYSVLRVGALSILRLSHISLNYYTQDTTF